MGLPNLSLGALKLKIMPSWVSAAWTKLKGPRHLPSSSQLSPASHPHFPVAKGEVERSREPWKRRSRARGWKAAALAARSRWAAGSAESIAPSSAFFRRTPAKPRSATKALLYPGLCE